MIVLQMHAVMYTTDVYALSDPCTWSQQVGESWQGPTPAVRGLHSQHCIAQTAILPAGLHAGLMDSRAALVQQGLVFVVRGMLRRHLTPKTVGNDGKAALRNAGIWCQTSAQAVLRFRQPSHQKSRVLRCRVLCWTTGLWSCSGRHPTWHASHRTQGWTLLQAQGHTASSSTSGEPLQLLFQHLRKQTLMFEWRWPRTKQLVSHQDISSWAE